jgi:hypothetical protein
MAMKTTTTATTESPSVSSGSDAELPCDDIRAETGNLVTTADDSSPLDEPSPSTFRSSSNSSSSTPRMEEAWNGRFEELKRFGTKHGDCNVPLRRYPGKSLGSWVKYQRQQYRKYVAKDPTSKMTPERIRKLESVGFQWKPRLSKREMWDVRFKELKQFRSEYGHCNVPYRCYRKNKALRIWMTNLRHQYKNYKAGKKYWSITPERIKKLEEIGFEWKRKRQTYNEETRLPGRRIKDQATR